MKNRFYIFISCIFIFLLILEITLLFAIKNYYGDKVLLLKGDNMSIYYEENITWICIINKTNNAWDNCFIYN